MIEILISFVENEDIVCDETKIDSKRSSVGRGGCSVEGTDNHQVDDDMTENQIK